MKDGQFVQVGTPQELVLSPRDDYVRAFVKDAPRAKVLTAGAIMSRHLRGHALNGRAVPSDAPLQALLALLAEHDAPLTVLEDGAPVGTVDRGAVIRALVEEDAARALDA